MSETFPSPYNQQRRSLNAWEKQWHDNVAEMQYKLEALGLVIPKFDAGTLKQMLDVYLKNTTINYNNLNKLRVTMAGTAVIFGLHLDQMEFDDLFNTWYAVMIKDHFELTSRVYKIWGMSAL